MLSSWFRNPVRFNLSDMTKRRSRLLAAALAGATAIGTTMLVAAAPAQAATGVFTANLSIWPADERDSYGVQVSGLIKMSYGEAWDLLQRDVVVMLNMQGDDGSAYQSLGPVIGIFPNTPNGLTPTNEGLRYTRTFHLRPDWLDEDSDGADEIVAAVSLREGLEFPGVPVPGVPSEQFVSNKVTGDFSGHPPLSTWPPQPPSTPLPPAPAPPPPVTVPHLIGDTPNQARQELEAVGLTLAVPGGVVDCNNLGRIASASPAAGVQVAPGTAVAVKVGERPKPPKVCQ